MFKKTLASITAGLETLLKDLESHQALKSAEIAAHNEVIKLKNEAISFAEAEKARAEQIASNLRALLAK